VTRPNNPASVYLDSNTLIAVVKKEPGYEPVDALFRLAEAGRIDLYISALSYVEVRGSSLSGPVDGVRDRQIIASLDSPWFKQVEFYRGLALRARRFTQEYKLKNYDAMHLASAAEAGAEVLMTWDQGFPHGRNIEGVWIDQPYEPGDPALFTV
jgi:predicted nucleic acid-binding protein